jgi:hypothetical protein
MVEAEVALELAQEDITRHQSLPLLQHMQGSSDAEETYCEH